MKTNKRLKTITEIQSLVSYQNANPDHILWSKTWDYDPNFWFQFTFNGKAYTLYLQGEDCCACIDYRLYLCGDIDDFGGPVDEICKVHQFNHPDETKAKAWAERWLLKAMKHAAEHNLPLEQCIKI